MKKQLKKAENEISKGFWKSVGITFLVAFLLAISPALGDAELSWQAIKGGVLVGSIFTACRVALKAVVEFVIAWFSK